LLDRDFTPTSGTGGQPSIWVYALFAVLGGLLLNVMPCVLPVIALKIFGLVKMAGDEPRRVRRLGWAFSAGILASFLVLALLVILFKLAGQQVGWGFQFQEPLFVIFMSAVVFAFGLSLFGVYEIRLPGAAVAGVSSTLARQEGKGGGYGSSFSEGVFATILATPCTAPFLGSALGFAFAQPAGGIVLIFGLAAFGMALPYLLLTARPAWLKYLPKPGAWMETAKQFMGFLMMATLLWLLYILGKQLGMEAVIWTGAFLLAIAVAAWLMGRFATLTASRKQVFLIWALSLLIAAGGYLYFIESALNIRAAIAGEPGGQNALPAGDGIAWEPFSTTALEAHLRAGKPVFLDFTAEWCLTCKVNERTVLHDQVVVERFRSSGIVAMKADWTNRNPDITRLLSRFGRSGVPLYVVFRAGDAVSPAVLPEVITTGIVLDAVAHAVAPGQQPAAQ
jgi:thiol:disulfide interchange protein DsbD